MVKNGLKRSKNIGMAIGFGFSDFCVGDFIEMRQILHVLDLGNVIGRHFLV